MMSPLTILHSQQKLTVTPTRIWSSLSRKLSQHCLSLGETAHSQGSIPLGWRLPASAGGSRGRLGVFKYILICDIFTLRRASVEEHLHGGMWCASSDRLGLLQLQLFFSKNEAFLSHVTTEQIVSVRSSGGGSTWCLCVSSLHVSYPS